MAVYLVVIVGGDQHRKGNSCVQLVTVLVAAAVAHCLLTLHLHVSSACRLCLVLCWDVTPAAEATCTALPSPFVMLVKYSNQGVGMQQLEEAVEPDGGDGGLRGCVKSWGGTCL